MTPKSGLSLKCAIAAYPVPIAKAILRAFHEKIRKELIKFTTPTYS